MSAGLEGQACSWTNGRRAAATLAGSLLAALALAVPAGAATYAPDTTSDSPFGVAGDCNGAAPPGSCSLRDAVAAANDTSDDDVIVLEGKTYTLDGFGGIFVSEAGGQFGGGRLLIRGTSARETIVTAEEESDLRPFTFDAGSRVELRDLALTGGGSIGCGECNGDGNGGGLMLRDGEEGDAEGLLTRVRVNGNTAYDDGGGILNRGKLTLVQSLVDGNVARIDGGGIANEDELTLVNSTISGNQALGQLSALSAAPSDFGNGGGIHNTGDRAEGGPGSAFVDAENTTITGNVADGNGGGVFTKVTQSNDTAQATLSPDAKALFHNTIVSDNTADGDSNCYGNQPASSEGHNLEDGDSCLFTASGDLDKGAKLGALANNGGGTDTHALAADSPALNAAEAEGCPSVDQRGTARPQGGACDIGAFERVPDPAPEQEQQQQQTQQQLPAPQSPGAPRDPRCLDSVPPITTLKRADVRVGSDEVRLRGKSRDLAEPCISGVHRVEVALARVSGTDLNCRFLRRSNRFLLSPFMNCRRSIRFVAEGTNRWSYRFKVALPAGKYRLTARAYDEARNKETPRKRRNIVPFTVR